MADRNKWTEAERSMALRLMRTYFSIGQSVRNFDWDWRNDRYDIWLHMAREALKPAEHEGLSSEKLIGYCQVHSKRMMDEGFPKTSWLIDVLSSRLNIQARQVTCETCNGIGWLYSDSGPAPREIDCPDCSGAGEWEDEEDEEV